MSASVLDRARAGDHQAFDELTGSLLSRIARALLSNARLADRHGRLLQETLLAAWRGLDGYAGRASIRAWRYRIATNRCLDAIRDARRRVPALLTDDAWLAMPPAPHEYLGHPDTRIGHPTGIVVLTMSRDRVSRITRFLDDDLPRRFGLPRSFAE